MTAKRTKTRREIANQLQKALGAFGLFIIVWGILHLISNAVDPFGVLSLLAGVSFVLAIVAGLALMIAASPLLRH